MWWASKTFSNEQSDPCIPFKKSTFSTGCADRMARSKKLGSKRHFVDSVTMHDLVFDRKSPFSTHRSDCRRIGLKANLVYEYCARSTEKGSDVEDRIRKIPSIRCSRSSKYGWVWPTVIMREMAPVGEMAPGCGKRSKK